MFLYYIIKSSTDTFFSFWLAVLLLPPIYLIIYKNYILLFCPNIVNMEANNEKQNIKSVLQHHIKSVLNKTYKKAET